MSTLLALLLLSSCASSPTVVKKYETVEVLVPVHTPIPPEVTKLDGDCRLSESGPLLVTELMDWVICQDSLEEQARQKLNEVRQIQEAHEQ